MVSGRASVTDSGNFVVVRYNSEGILDNSFGDSGIVSTNIDTGFDSAESLALQTDGKIVVGGTSCVPSSCNLTVARYNQNGSLDISFDTDGKVTVPLGSSGELKSSIALQTDGKIVISGTDMNGIANGDPLDFAVARFLPGGRTKFDFDNDGKSDISVFRPGSGAWYLLQSTAGFSSISFGSETDKLVPADYDGDGKTDVAVYRNGVWYLQRSQAGFTGVTFGDINDIPVSADYDGDGKTDIAVFRPSNGYWYILNSTDNQTSYILFGQTGDKPVAADYDGDGKSDLAVNRNGIWYIQRSHLGFTRIAFGDANDKLVPADYDGDGKTDVAVFRPSTGVWYLQQSTAGFAGIVFGLETDIPVTADYDGDGKSDLAVVRNGIWYLSRSTQGFTGISFGVTTDRPIPNAFVR